MYDLFFFTNCCLTVKDGWMGMIWCELIWALIRQTYFSASHYGDMQFLELWYNTITIHTLQGRSLLNSRWKMVSNWATISRQQIYLARLTLLAYHTSQLNAVWCLSPLRLIHINTIIGWVALETIQCDLIGSSSE